MTAKAEAPLFPPARPPGRILKAAEAKAWADGYAFVQTAKTVLDDQRNASRKAYGDGYAQGYEDGRSEGAAEATRIVNEVTMKVDRYLATLDNEITDLALDIVSRVLGSLDTGSIVAQAARQAIAGLRRSKYIRIAVHPAVESTVRAELQDMAANEPLPIEIRSDPDLPHDACVVSSDIVVIDASIQVQLEAIRASLQKPGPVRG